MAYLSLLVYFTVVLVRPHEWGAVYNEDSTIIRDSLLFCLVFYVLRSNRNMGAPQFTMMILFLIANFLSLAMDGEIAGAFERIDTQFRNIFVPYALISGLVDSLKKQYILFGVISGASLLMVLNGYYQINNELGLGLVGNPIYGEGGEARITYLGMMADPNDLGMFFVMTLPILFLFLKMSSSLFKLPIGVFILAILYGIFLTNSRGTLLATFSLILFWYLRKNGFAKTAFAGMLASPVLLVVMSSFREISSEEESAQGRLDAWATGLELFQQFPVFGIGGGAFTFENNGLTAHNSFVLAFAELGIAGCFVWVSLFVFTAVILWKIMNMSYLPQSISESDNKYELAKGESYVATALCYSMIAAATAGFFLSRTYIPLLYIYLGMCAACYGRVMQEFPKLKPQEFFDTKEVLKISLFITVGGIFVIWLGLQVFL